MYAICIPPNAWGASGLDPQTLQWWIDALDKQ